MARFEMFSKTGCKVKKKNEPKVIQQQFLNNPRSHSPGPVSAVHIPHDAKAQRNELTFHQEKN